MTKAALVLAFALGVAPQVVMACACCGEEDGQYFHTLQPGDYVWQVIEQLELGTNWLTHDDEGWEVAKIWHSGRDFTFETAAGPFRFVADPLRSERWVSDITFITQPDRNSIDMADMLQQVFLRGTIHLPPAAAQLLGQDTLEAVLTLSGVGTSCLETDTLRRWRLSASVPKHGWLDGGGPVTARTAEARLGS